MGSLGHAPPPLQTADAVLVAQAVAPGGCACVELAHRTQSIDTIPF